MTTSSLSKGFKITERGNSKILFRGGTHRLEFSASLTMNASVDVSKMKHEQQLTRTPPPVVPHPESPVAQAAYPFGHSAIAQVGLGPNRLFPGIGDLPGPATGSHIVIRGTPIARLRCGGHRVNFDPEARTDRRATFGIAGLSTTYHGSSTF